MLSMYDIIKQNNQWRGIMEKGSNKKLIRNFAVFIVLILVTLWVILKDQSIMDILVVLEDVKIQYVFVGIICMAVYIFLEGINMRRTLKALGEKTSIIQATKYSLIGFFFSSITPAASGGQPMQIYYMHKDKISVANSTLALLVNLTSMQIITISIALISLLFNYQYMNKILIILFVVGVMLNFSALAILAIGIFSRRLSKRLIKISVAVLKFLRMKNLIEKERRLLTELKKYHNSAKYLKGQKKLIAKVILTTLVQFLVYYSIAYWTYRSLGFNQSNIFEITTMQSVLFATVSGIPSPGSVGVSEGAFIEIFRNIYSGNMLKSATLLHRGINFYLFVFISGVVVVINEIRTRKRLGRKQ